MKNLKTFAGSVLAFFLLLLAAPAFALAAPAAFPELDVDQLAVYGGALVGFLEIVLRVLPTNKDYSILTKIVKILSLIVPNRAKTPKGTGVFTLVNFKKAK